MIATEMNKELLKYTIICLLFPITYGLSAKNYDTQLRTGLKIKSEIFKDFEGSIELQYRLNNNLLTYDKTLVEPELVYEFSKKWKVGLNYRLINNRTRSYNVEYRHRSATFLSYDQKLFTDFKFEVRSMLQYGFDDFSNSLFDNNKKLYNRNRFVVEYDLFGSPLSTFAGYEFFYHINNINGGIINQWRLSTGLDYKISKRSALSASYYFNNDRINPTTDDAHIISLKFLYTIR